ncbi:unnamed protein product [Ilex paraguariensis]|uniref:PsbP C-terminal domain-containing protein n=1 Tax=Ilex paraguariensis TaxID=185542 RepID=A0ABC8V5Q3_9AQUA
MATVTPISSIFSTSSASKSSSTLSHCPSKLTLKTHQTHKQSTLTRREFLKGLAFMPLILSPPPSEAREVEVGAYLPPSPSDPSFVLFKASSKDTPALRAGNVQPYKFIIPPTWKQTRVANILSGNYCQPKCAEPWVEVKFEDEKQGKIQLVTGNVQPYKFIIPPTWKQTRVANILSGNYCQPKCAEPWVEVKFEDEKQGKIQVVASPLIRLTNKPNATIEDIGSPEKVIASLGPFVTGNTYDPDELLESSIEKRGDLTYYKYVLETPFALTGSHNLAKATAKGNTVVLFVASANDKQWQTSEKTLKAMLDSFEV